MSSAVPVCPFCGHRLGGGHGDDCPGMFASWREVVEDVLAQLERLAAGDLAHTPDWRRHLAGAAHELLAAADWPTEYAPGSLVEMAADDGSTG